MLVDADDRTRESLVGLLGVHGRTRVVGSAGTVRDALALLKRERPEVLVVDPRLPELEAGLVFIRRARAVDAAVRILGVSWTTAHEASIRAAGADAFIRKTFRPHELADAVARCAESARGSAAAAEARPSEARPSDVRPPDAPAPEVPTGSSGPETSGTAAG
jgi:DNA-binding NarL/FixJ family response regulator